MRWYRALLCLLVIQLAACTSVPTAQPAAGQDAIPTRGVTLTADTPEPVFTPSTAPSPSASPPAAPSAAPTASPTTAPSTSPTAAPSAAVPQPTGETPAMEEPSRPVSATPVLATPIGAAQSWRQPWQYFSGAANGQGSVIYRLRYPAGWYAQAGQNGEAVFQNTPLGSRDELAAGRAGAIQLSLRLTRAERAGGLLPPNQRELAAGWPGTRQILKDAARGVTVWNVRLYGLNESSTTFNLAGQLSGSTAEIEGGIRLLEAMLQSLELYASPDPLPEPVPAAYSPAEGWQWYGGRLQAGAASPQLYFRLPPGWWAYPFDDRFIEVTNYVIDPFANSAGPAGPGTIKLSFSAASCASLGSCPVNPPLLGDGRWRGTREIVKSPEGYTIWTVRILFQEAQITLFAILVGADDEVERGILTLNMLLRTLEINP